MKNVRALIVILVLALTLSGCSATTYTWVKGNLHTHTSNSDGDSPPEVVVEWYRNNGYQFLVISDHEKRTPVEALGNGITLIPGEELAAVGDSLPTHANAIGIEKTIVSPEKASSPGASAARLIERVRENGGIPMLNHPYFYWLFGYPELKQIKEPYLLEIYNGAYDPKKWGEAFFLTAEQMWDELLSAGCEVYGTATDDSHQFKNVKNEPRYPGRGWVMARVREQTAPEILDALRRGDFYSSTGVELADFGFDGKTFLVNVKPKPGLSYSISFIGKGGKTLQETTGISASWKHPGGEDPNAYVRCKITASDKTSAWTQAFRFK